MGRHTIRHPPRADVNPRRVARHFLSQTDKDIINAMLKQNYDVNYIAQKIMKSRRQIKEYINLLNKQIVNKFTFEDDQRLIDLYNKDIQKESKLVQYFPDKTAWMIRNRLKLLKRRNQLYSLPESVPPPVLMSVTPAIPDELTQPIQVQHPVVILPQIPFDTTSTSSLSQKIMKPLPPIQSLEERLSIAFPSSSQMKYELIQFA